MVMRVEWTDSAKKRLKKIHQFYLEKVGIHIAERVVLKLANSTVRLKTQPEIGQKEPLLADRKEDFRYLVVGHYKLIYEVNKTEKIVTVRTVFDTRRNPKKLKRLKGK